MKKIFVALLACVSLTTLGIEALTPEDYIYQTTEQAAPPPLTPTKETTVEKHCHRGPRGHRGKKGKRGKRGRRGANGEAFVAAYAGALRYVGDSGNVVMDPGLVAFTEESPRSGIDVNEDYVFTVQTAGVYSIEYAVKGWSVPDGETFPPERLQVDVWINGETSLMTHVPFCRTFLVEDTEEIHAEASNQIIRDLNVGDTIHLEVHLRACDGERDIAPAYYGTNYCGPIPEPSQISAYISIKKIG